MRVDSLRVRAAGIKWSGTIQTEPEQEVDFSEGCPLSVTSTQSALGPMGVNAWSRGHVSQS